MPSAIRSTSCCSAPRSWCCQSGQSRRVRGRRQRGHCAWRDRAVQKIHRPILPASAPLPLQSLCQMTPPIRTTSTLEHRMQAAYRVLPRKGGAPSFPTALPRHTMMTDRIYMMMEQRAVAHQATSTCQQLKITPQDAGILQLLYRHADISDASCCRQPPAETSRRCIDTPARAASQAAPSNRRRVVASSAPLGGATTSSCRATKPKRR